MPIPRKIEQAIDRYKKTRKEKNITLLDRLFKKPNTIEDYVFNKKFYEFCKDNHENFSEKSKSKITDYLKNNATKYQELLTKHTASTMIKSTIRGHIVRKDIKNQSDVATKIQGLFRVKKAKKIVSAIKSEQKAIESEKALTGSDKQPGKSGYSRRRRK